ncbi:MAG: phosphate/phosphite/phosphonate ABC transporter substrate-binding protein [Acidobacteria bacterium]|nr:phosphate/phosphite/phosphonate ABC transporter substrate-binding protein [Acidobacteriota bacterium]
MTAEGVTVGGLSTAIGSRTAQWAVAACVALAACGRPVSEERSTPTVSIDFSRRVSTATLPVAASSTRSLHIAVAGMTSPPETLRYYQELFDYMGRKLGLAVRMKQRKTYQEVNELLLSGELDAAFLCSGGYVRAGKSLASEILAVPVIRGKATYQAYLIVHQDSPVSDFAGLRGRSFAFTDPLSNSGWLFPVSRLIELGATPSSYFSRITYTYGHDRSIEAVAHRIVDGASVDSLVYDYMAAAASGIVKHTRVIDRSPWFGMPPVVASPKLDRAAKDKLRIVLLTLQQDAEGIRILRKLSIDQFDRGEERHYDSIRQAAQKVGPWRP